MSQFTRKELVGTRDDGKKEIVLATMCKKCGDRRYVLARKGKSMCNASMTSFEIFHKSAGCKK